MSADKLKYLSLLLLFLLSVLSGCGGGTVGTGTGPSPESARLFEGVVRNSETSAPYPDVTVTLEETGAQTTTNSNGEFRLPSSKEMPQATFTVKGPTVDATASIPVVDNSSQKIAIEILITTNSQIAEIKHVTARVSMVDNCDPFFENSSPIRQSVRVPEGTLCTLRIVTRKDGEVVGKVPYALQRKGCNIGDSWVTMQTGATGVGLYRGIGEVTFPFKDSIGTCRYRIALPFGISALPQLNYLIESFTAQAED